MASGWRYRLGGVVGSAALASLSVALVNHAVVQAAIAMVPVLGSLTTDPSGGNELLIEAGTTAFVVMVALVPLYKPRPRRILDIVMEASRRTMLAILALATIGYFDYTYRLPRATLIVAGAVMLLTVPAWFVAIRRRPADGGNRTIIVGDDPDTMADILDAVEGEVLGYVSPLSAYDISEADVVSPSYADGGVPTTLDDLRNLGGLSRLDEVLVDHDVDTAVVAFAHPGRAEFFGTLDTCFEHGVSAKVHRDHADAVLTSGVAAQELVDIDLEPWDPQDHLVKRAFDLVFAAVGIVLLAPVALAIAIGIKLEDGGPVLYNQERTAAFGDTFTVYKFRSMVPEAEQETGATLSDEDAGGIDPRVTRVGRFIRRTHLDEIPQLGSVLLGDMSVVGPRPERPELDEDYGMGIEAWRSRWFVRPGLTGLAQIRGATGYDPEEKIRHDVEYIRHQSFWFDLKIVVRQIWMVLEDASEIGRSRGGPE